MHYTLHQLLVLARVAEYQSITKAAEALHLSQPAVSIQLKKLQEQFQVPLFHIRSKKVFMTDFGAVLVQTALEMANKLEALHYQSKGAAGALSGRLSLSIVSTGKYIIPYLMADFMKIHPHVDISLEVSNRYNVLAHLQENSTDLALVSIWPEDLDLESIVISENNWYLACAYDKLDFFKKEIEAGNWSKVPMILREKGSGTRTMMEKFFSDREIHVESKMELATNEAVKQAVMAGLGASVLSNFSMTQELKDKRLALIPYPGFPLKADWRLIWLKQKKHAPAVNAFIRWLGENRTEIFKDHFPDLETLKI